MSYVMYCEQWRYVTRGLCIAVVNNDSVYRVYRLYIEYTQKGCVRELTPGCRRRR
jgi:hypothetical protein